MVGFSVTEWFTVIKPMLFFILGLAIYSIVIYNLYRFVATRDIFELNLRQYNRFQHAFLYKIFAIILYLLEYLLFFPLFLTMWFILFSILITALTKNQSVDTVFLMSLAIISSIRTVSYYSQSIAKDIAKLIPLTLIVVALSEGFSNIFSWERSFELIKSIPSWYNLLVYYFVFVLLLEIILRALYSMRKASRPKKLKL